DFTGWVGMSITVGNAPLIVSSLGRMVATGNISTHTVKIVDAATGTDITGGVAAISTAGATVGTFVYGALLSPVTLNPSTTYYILSQETKNGENFYDSSTTAQTTNAAVL